MIGGIGQRIQFSRELVLSTKSVTQNRHNIRCLPKRGEQEILQLVCELVCESY